MASNPLQPGPPRGSSPTEWTEAEKAEMVEYYKFCIEQRDNCITRLEELYQEQKEMKKQAGDKDESDDEYQEIQIQLRENARIAADQVDLMGGYLEILHIIEKEVEGSGLSLN
ncbi:hypothetical protein FAUST_1352 [Fusarium austroamericanum]|uniref:Uncharacterized protein n=1 Tax=Fusarium austroamericanum TaxID=282268 RepID=A0AAN6C8I9_FUSAU|nr:hypothetical protein FAUST_1352 [Fusarium austroamericanum]